MSNIWTLERLKKRDKPISDTSKITSDRIIFEDTNPFKEIKEIEEIKEINSLKETQEKVIRRDEGIGEINRELTEIKELMNDLASLTRVNRETIDTIESMIEKNVKTDIEKGVEELRKAEKHQKKSLCSVM